MIGRRNLRKNVCPVAAKIESRYLRVGEMRHHNQCKENQPLSNFSRIHHSLYAIEIYHCTIALQHDCKDILLASNIKIPQSEGVVFLPFQAYLKRNALCSQ
jgi:hypothetical protein